jgi:hypothetical protein
LIPIKVEVGELLKDGLIDCINNQGSNDRWQWKSRNEKRDEEAKPNDDAKDKKI